MAAFFMVLALRRGAPISYLRLLLCTSFFVALSYFTGSKAAVLSVLVVVVLYVHYFVKN